MTNQTAVLELEKVSVTYVEGQRRIPAVRGVSLSVKPNEIVGVVGESGSGKSTLAFAIMRLLRSAQVQGTIRVMGQNMFDLGPRELRKFRWQTISMVFQSAMNALNPVMTVESQIADTIRYHRPEVSRDQILQRIDELADLVRIDRARFRNYPHELSGGMRQRVVIAIAIALDPQVVIMDEPTTALDVVVQRTLLERVMEVQRHTRFSILFISHDLGLVAEIVNRVAIMYAGRIVELTSGRLIQQTDVPHHPYTQGLLAAIPRLTAQSVVVRGIPGTPPDMAHLPVGCPFAPRCAAAMPQCRAVDPPLAMIDGAIIACHLFESNEGGA